MEAASLYYSIRRKDWNETRLLLWSSRRVIVNPILQRTDDPLGRLLNQRDALGATVVHYACSIPDIPVDVIVALLDAVATRVQDKTNDADLTDTLGSTLVHYAAASGSAATLSLLLQRIPTACIRQSNGKLYCCPCRLAWYCYFRKHPQERDESSSAVSLKERIRQLTSASLQGNMDMVPPAVRDLWKKTMLWTRHVLRSSNQLNQSYQYPDSEPRSLWMDLVLLIMYGSLRPLDCPTLAVWLALQMGDFDLMKPVPDTCLSDRPTSTGNLLLHVAAGSPPLTPLCFGNDSTHDPSDGSETDRTLDTIPPRVSAYLARHGGQGWIRHGQSSVVTQLCTLAPRAASVPNALRQWPLHLAIDQGQPWTDGVQSIVQAYPLALVIPDPVSGLEPLLQAAQAKQCSLSTLFELIRNHADLLCFDT